MLTSLLVIQNYFNRSIDKVELLLGISNERALCWCPETSVVRNWWNDQLWTIYLFSLMSYTRDIHTYFYPLIPFFLQVRTTLMVTRLLTLLAMVPPVPCYNVKKKCLTKCNTLKKLVVGHQHSIKYDNFKIQIVEYYIVIKQFHK